MTATINGRTPEEIKKGLEKCPNADCTLCLSSFHCDLEADALAYIQQLERERDALFAETKGFCSSCAFRERCHTRPGMFDNSPPHRLHLGDCEEWQWRGPQEVE